jgi:hypothetical protein
MRSLAAMRTSRRMALGLRSHLKLRMQGLKALHGF